MLNEFEELASLPTDDESSVEFLKESGIYDVKISKAELSPEGAKPYIALTFVTDEVLVSTFRLGRVYSGLSEIAIKIRKENLKQLFTNAGVKISSDGEQMVKDLVGKKVRALFKKREYATIDKDNNNEPIKRTKIEYSYCRKIGAQMNAKESYFFQGLNDRDQRKYNDEYARWEKMNASAGNSNSSQQEEGDELPF